MSSEDTSKTILLRGTGVQGESIASGAITPGHLILVGGTTVAVHGTALAPAMPAFAVESMDGGTIDTAYAADDNVYYVIASFGSCVNALLKAGENIAAKDKLVSAGDGTLKKFAAASGGNVVAIADEAVNNSAGSDAVRLKVLTGPVGYIEAV